MRERDATSTNLPGNDWTYVVTDHETGTAEVDSFFDAVTNAVPFTTDEGFISLEIRESF